MARNAIFFPYINIPANSWLFRMALYWDTLSSIVPYDYIEDPDRLAPGMRDLVTSGLVQQIQPGMYAEKLVGWYPPFLEYARNWRDSRAGELGTQLSRIHVEKMQYLQGSEADPTNQTWANLKDDLLEIGVAIDDGSSWIKMPTPLADDFMAYLAGALGQLDELDAVPVTNSVRLGASLSPAPEDVVRAELLEDLLPIPAGSEPLTIDDVLSFKQRHAGIASLLRERLEQECVEIAKLEPELRAYALRSLKTKLRSEIDEVRDAMRIRWTCVMAGVLPILGATLPLLDPTGVATMVGGIFSIGGAFYTATETIGKSRAARKKPIAYAALLRDRLGS